MEEAADDWQVDRSTIMRILTVTKGAALHARAESRPGSEPKELDPDVEAVRADATRLGEVQEMAVILMLVGGPCARG